MAEDSNPNRPYNADEHQEVPGANPGGPKSPLTLDEGNVPSARGGDLPADTLNADPDPPQPDEKDPAPKDPGTLEDEVGPARG